jgi:hypothetical protein
MTEDIKQNPIFKQLMHLASTSDPRGMFGPELVVNNGKSRTKVRKSHLAKVNSYNRKEPDGKI